MNKTQCQRVHAKQRCFERYGESINRDDLDEIAKMILSKDAVRARLVEKQSMRVSIWIVLFRNKEMKVVYDKKRGTVVSFLPMEDRRDDICTLA